MPPRRLSLALVFIWTVFAVALRASVNPAVTPVSTGDLTAEEVAQGYRSGVILAKPRASHRTRADNDEPGEGFTMHRKYSRFGDLRVLKIPAGGSVAEAIARLKATGRYEFVEPDYLRHARTLPNDPNLSLQWGLSNFGQTGGISGADIHAQFGWDVLHDAPNVIVAIIDSGIRATHQDLAANLWTNPSPSSSNDLHGIRYTSSTGRVTSGNPNDDDGHGTHVAGIIGAVGNNGIGVSGVAWKVQLMALKFLTATSGGSPSDEIACIDYAIAHGASIINASFGDSNSSQAEQTAIAAARDAGVIFVTAAGNGDGNGGIGFNVDNGNAYPAGYLLDNVVTVAASDATDNLTAFSNFGSGTVDLAAPGDKIYSTFNSSDSSYQVESGTSMATPYVVGTLALLKAKFPNDNYRQLINRLLRSVTPLASMSGKVQSGGRLNLQAALNSTDNRPLNDDFAARAALSGSNVRVRSSNVGATTESSEPTPASVTGAGASLWWTWTAPASTQVTFDTAGSTYDTVIGVYTGSSIASLVSVGGNDDVAAGTTTSRLTLDVTAGTTYQIAVAGKAGATGQTILRIGSVPANDTFAKAQTVTGQSFVAAGTNLNATSETGESKPIAKSTGRTVWYKWIAPTSGRYLLSAFATQIDTTAAVYTGSAVNALTTIGSNDNISSLDSDALVPFNATANQTYYFAVDCTNTEGGDFWLSLVDGAWEYPTLGSVMSSPAAASDGTLYFGAGATDDASALETRVHAVNPDGTVKWTRSTGGAFDVSSPAVGPDGTVYIGSGSGSFYALTAAAGTQKWRVAATTAIGSSPAIAADGTIYFHDDAKLYALADNATIGVTKWTFAFNGTTYASPAIGTDGTIYIGSTGGNFYAVNPSGTQKWVFAADDDIYTTAAIGGDGTIYFGTLSGGFYALNPNGTQKWKWSAPAKSSITSSPALGVDGTIYFAAYDNNLYALNSDGTQKWAFAAADQVRASSPAIGADGTIYFGDYDFQIYAVNPNGTLKRTYATGQLVRSSPLIANNRLYFGSNDSKFYAIDIGQNAAPSFWPMFRQNTTRVSRALAPAAAPTIVTAPTTQTVGLGGGLVLTVAVNGPGPFSYQWNKNGTPIAGATGSSYTVPSADASTAGSYTVTVTAVGGASTTSAPAVVTTAQAVPARLTNLSVETTAGGSQTLTLGFVLSGSPDKTLLVRGVGPGLVPFGLTGTLTDPVLTVLGPNSSTNVAASNNDWSNSTAAAMTAAGAFPLTNGSKDAALLTTLAAGNYTAQITGAAPGLALAEIYDTAIGSGAKLINLSTSAQVTAGGTLTAGFTISGNVAKKVLIRGIGPALSAVGVTSGTLTDPVLELYDSHSNLLQSNDDWGAASTLTDAFTATGAFKFTTTKDAVLLVTLAPGGYTAVVRGANGTSGLALVEIYEVP